ncbi:MAG: hypothetical protein M3M84_03000 [Thermoproteota archaeon]|nr:hypothetical protein [Thermoproteota archaeon]
MSDFSIVLPADLITKKYIVQEQKLLKRDIWRKDTSLPHRYNQQIISIMLRAVSAAITSVCVRIYSN